jgi:iron complex outermembrane recepter protein
MKARFELLVRVAALPLIVAAQPALAQTADTAQPTAAPTTPAAAPAAGDQFGDIVVTAQRRSERLQNVPATITAFTAVQLEAQGIQSTKDLTRITPGLNMTQSIAYAQPTLRGLGTRSVTADDESVVPIYVDGVYQSFVMSLFTDLNSVERIEVLKGPQGALLGRNATGGAINIITRTPGPGVTGDFSLSYGRFNDVVAKGYLAVGNDHIAADLAAVYSYDKGYIVDTLRGNRFGGRDNFGIRGKIVWHALPDLDFTLAGSLARNFNSLGVAFRALNGNSVGLRVPGNYIETRPYHVAISNDAGTHSRQNAGSLTSVYHGDGFEVTGITSYQFNSSNYLNDSDSTPADIASSNLVQYSKSSYNELYLTTDANNPFSVVVGGVYYWNNAGYYSIRQISRSVSATGVIGAPSITQLSPDNTMNSFAGYVQGTYKFTDTLSLTAGGRYTTEARRYYLQPATGAAISRARDFHRFTPTGTLQFQPNAGLNIYAKVGQAYKAGIMSNQSSATSDYINPELVTQYELGTKVIVNPALRFNLAAYYTDYKDLQVATRDPVNPLATKLQNAGRGEIYGLEFEMFARPARNLNIIANASLMSAKYRDFKDAQVFFPNTAVTPTNLCTAGSGALTGGNRSAFCDASGKNIIRTPFVQLNLSGNYTIPLASGDEIALSGGASYQGKSYWDINNLVVEKAYTLLDARAGYRFGDNKHFELALWGRNLGNAHYRITTNVSATTTGESDARPRTYGVEFKAKF